MSQELQNRIDRAVEALEDFYIIFGDRLCALSYQPGKEPDAISCLVSGTMLERVRLILKGLE